MSKKSNESGISSGWKGSINGHIKDTESWIKAKSVEINLDYKTAWALCNLLTKDELTESAALGADQKKRLLNLGQVLGRFIDHGASKNLSEAEE